MNGEISQMVTLATYGNLFVKGHLNAPMEDKLFNNANLVFKTKTGKLKQIFSKGIIAKTTDDWFRYLLNNNCSSVKMKYFQLKDDDHVTSAFVGGGSRWIIICNYKFNAEIWIPTWELVKEETPTRWEITYTMVDRIPLNQIQYTDFVIIELKLKLESILRRIGDFAVLIDFSGWKSSFFDQGIIALTDEIDQDFILIPTQYDIEARRLMNSVAKSWVFGGMGSWNDSPQYNSHQIGKEEEYHELTQELYSTILECIECVVNSYEIKK